MSGDDQLRERQIVGRIAQRLCDAELGEGAWEDWVLSKEIERYMAAADALLPLVREYADQRAAEEVRAAADRYCGDGLSGRALRSLFHGYADTLATAREARP